MNEEFRMYGYEENETIDIQVFLGDMWRGLIKFWWVFLAAILLFGSIQFYRTFICYQPVYTCTATYTVQTENVNSVGDSGLSTYVFSYTKSVSDQLTTVFSYAVSNPVLRQKVCADLKTAVFPVAVQARCLADSNLLSMTVRGSDPALTYQALLSIVDNCPYVTDNMIGRTKLLAISEPVFPESPSNSRDWILSVVLGGILGFGIGLTWIIVYALLRSTVRTKEDIRTKLNSTCLNALPLVTFPKNPTDTKVVLSNESIGGDFLESVRLLRSAVKTGLGEEEKVMMITSTAPGEGKSVVCLNLAAMFAKHGSRTLVIDCDLHRSGIDALISDKKLAWSNENKHYSVFHAAELDVDVLGFHGKEIVPRHVLREDFLSSVIGELREQYDYILIDTPPCGVVSDALSVARVVDGVIYVVRQDMIMLNSIRAALSELMQYGTKILGCVLNGATGGYGGYGSYYSYRGYYRYYRNNYYYTENRGKRSTRQKR